MISREELRCRYDGTQLHPITHRRNNSQKGTTMDPIKTVVQEALSLHRDMYSAWLKMQHTTAAERQLAETKIGLIDLAMKENSK